MMGQIPVRERVSWLLLAAGGLAGLLLLAGFPGAHSGASAGSSLPAATPSPTRTPTPTPIPWDDIPVDDSMGEPTNEALAVHWPNVYVVVLFSPGDQVRFLRSTDGGYTWEPARLLAEPGIPTLFMRPGAGSGGADALYVVFGDNETRRVWFMQSLDSGVTWSDPVVVRQSPDHWPNRAKTVVDGAGAIYVAYFECVDAGGNGYYDLARSTDGGATFSPPVPVNPEILPNTAMWENYTLVSGQAALFVAYADRGRIMLTRSTDGGQTWSDPVRVDDGDSGGEAVDLAVDDAGVLYAAWDDARKDRRHFLTYVARSTDGGATWSPGVRVDDAGDCFKYSVSGAIAWDAGTVSLHVALADGRNYCGVEPYYGWNDVFYTHTTDGGLTWSPNEQISNPLPYNWVLRPSLQTWEGVVYTLFRGEGAGWLWLDIHDPHLPPVTTTPTPTPTDTPTPTSTPTVTPTATETPTPRPTATFTPNPTATPTDTPTVTPTATSTPTATPTGTPGPTATAAPSPTVTATPSSTPIPPVWRVGLPLLPALPAGAAVHPAAAPGGAAAATPPFDPQQVVNQTRNRYQEVSGVLASANGRRQIVVNDWGMTFVPYLDGEPHPEYRLGLRLLAVRAGDQALFAASPEGGAAPFRADETTAAYTRTANLREEYRALDFSVEQVYVLPRPPAEHGDLVVTSLVSTTLAPERAGGGLRFPLAGGAELTYDGALARDAAGRELPLEISWDDGQVELRVPADWLAAATYPLEIDPLLDASNLAISSASNDQVAPAVAADPVNGRYLVVWGDDQNGANDADIYGCIVNANGTPGDPFLIYADNDDYNQKTPAVAYDAVGGYYLVVWQDDEDGAADILGRRVTPAGSPVDELIHICTADGDQVTPAVAVDLEDGDYRYLVTWTDYADDTDGDVRGQIVKSDGTLGDAIDVAIEADWTEQAPAVAYSSASDRWLVVWEDSDPADPDLNLYGRQFYPDGSDLGSVITIATASGSDQAAPTIAYNNLDDEFLVAWEDDRNGMLLGWDIYGQRVSGAGSPEGSNFAVNSGVANQRYPVAAYGGTNDYLVAWQEGTNAIKSQQVSNAGALTEGLYTLSTCGFVDVCERPAVALNTGHNLYLAVWQYKSALGGTYDLKAQRLDHSR